MKHEICLMNFGFSKVINTYIWHYPIMMTMMAKIVEADGTHGTISVGFIHDSERMLELSDNIRISMEDLMKLCNRFPVGFMMDKFGNARHISKNDIRAIKMKTNGLDIMNLMENHFAT